MTPNTTPEPEGLLAELGIDPTRASGTLWRVTGLALRYRGRFALATGASLAASLAGIAAPRLLGRAVDAADLPVAAARDSGPLVMLGAALFAVLACRGLLQMAAGYNGELLGQNVARDLRLAYFEALQRLDFAFHDRVHSGDLITRGMLDLEGMRGFIEVGLQRSIQLALLLVTGAIVLSRIDPVMAAVTLSFVPVVLWRAGRMGLRLRLAWTRLQRSMAVLTRVMEESLQGARVVRAFGAASHELRGFDRTGDEALALSERRIQVRARAMATINSAFYLAMALALWVGWRRVAAGVISIGQLAECLAYMTLLQLPVRQVSLIMNSAARAVSAGARVFEILDARPRIVDRAGAVPLVVADGELRFEDVHLNYRDGQPPALSGVSFAVRRGETLGIVGASGSGKSSIAHLIPRFYDPSAGRISIDGQDIRGVTIESLRTAVGLVQQDVFLFDDSAAANIAYAAPDADEHDIAEAARAAAIHDHFDALRDGYASRVGERGAALSGGQRQRAAIARGLVPEPAILVLDDATSAVDAITEHRVRRGLRSATAAQAIVLVSHRLSSLMHADEILVLDAGRVVERGTHAALMAQGGRYAALFALQDLAAAPERRRSA